MMPLRLSQDALRDLEAIQERGVEEFGAVSARRYMAGFTRVFALLREQPLAGPVRPELGPGVRTFLHRPHKVVYRLEQDIVVVSRIVHGAQIDFDVP